MVHLLDDFRPPSPQRKLPALNRQAMPAAQPSRPSTPPKPVIATPAPGPKRQWRERLKWAVVIAVSLFAGLLLQVFPLGYLAVVIYGVIAIIKRLPSRLTFTLALVTLTLAPLGVALGQAALANGFSLIGFLLLTVGVVTLGIELIKERRRTINSNTANRL